MHRSVKALLAAFCAAAIPVATIATAHAQTREDPCADVIRDVSQLYGGFGLAELLQAGGETMARVEELERELAALDAEWQAARYEHEQDAVAYRMAGPEALWNLHRKRLDCIANEIERLLGEGRPGSPPPTIEQKRKAEEVKRRARQPDPIGPKIDAAIEKSRKRVIPGGPNDTGITVVGGFSVGYRFGPDVDFGRNGSNGGPYNKADEEVMFTQGSLDISFSPTPFRPGVPSFGGPDAPGGLRFGLNVLGDIGNNLEKFGSSNSPGFITIIDGSNPALTPITASQDAQVKSDWWSIALNPYLEWRRFIAAGTWIRLRFGPHFEYGSYDYDFRETVSGGGPFFSHRLDYEFDVTRYGAMFGAGVEQRLGDGFGWRADAYALPSWRDLELRGRQSGSALGGARAKDDDNGLGLLAGLNAGLWVRLSPGIRLDATVGGAWRSDAPAVRYPNAGGEKLRARTDGAFDAMARAQITIRLLDPPIADRIR